LRDLRQREAKLFGSAADENAGGQGCFLLQVTKQPKLQDKEATWPQQKDNPGSAYLGFGLLQSGNQEKGNFQPHRQAIREGGQFTLQLCFKPWTADKDIHSLRKLLEIWGLLGGLGSRARRGFGAISLVEMDGKTVTDSLDSYQQKITHLVDEGNSVKDFPPYTAFSKHADFAVIARGQKVREIHNQAGNIYRNGRGQPSTLRGEIKLPFGLPLTGVDDDRRRASPLFFHVHALTGNESVTTVLYLPAVFHPDYSQTKTKLAEFYQPLTEFLKMQKG
ncbi:MAG: hypothetical protein BWK78_09750, partial [Thiotrichaceae bacterium IS1]